MSTTKSLSPRQNDSSSNSPHLSGHDSNPPPLPPPLPTNPTGQQPATTQRHIKLKSNVSPFIRKLQEAPAGYWLESETPLPHVDIWASPTGFYFIYGTLMDPGLLAEILDLDAPPRLRPAKVVGYSLRLWGQYPALVNGETGEEVQGMAYEVTNQRHADRLAEYETKAYSAQPCTVRFTDGSGDEKISGHTFKYDGNPIDLDDGVFDMQVWLQRMRRSEKSQP